MAAPVRVSAPLVLFHAPEIDAVFVNVNWSSEATYPVMDTVAPLKFVSSTSDVVIACEIFTAAAFSV